MRQVRPRVCLPSSQNLVKFACSHFSVPRLYQLPNISNHDRRYYRVERLFLDIAKKVSRNSSRDLHSADQDRAELAVRLLPTQSSQLAHHSQDLEHARTTIRIEIGEYEELVTLLFALHAQILTEESEMQPENTKFSSTLSLQPGHLLNRSRSLRDLLGYPLRWKTVTIHWTRNAN